MGTPYCTRDDVRALLSADEQPGEGDVASLNDVAMAAAIDDAGDEIDSALGARYDVPFEPVPDMILRLTASIATYLATLTFYGSVDMPGTEPSVLRYQRARKLLDDLASGRAVVPDPDGSGGGPDLGGRSRVHNPYSGHLFGPEDFVLRPGGRDGRSRC